MNRRGLFSQRFENQKGFSPILIILYDYATFGNLGWLEDDSAIKIHAIAVKGNVPHGEVIGEGDINLPVIAEK